MFSKKL